MMSHLKGQNGDKIQICNSIATGLIMLHELNIFFPLSDTFFLHFVYINDTPNLDSFFMYA